MAVILTVFFLTLLFVRFFPERQPAVVINEVCTANVSAGADAQGKYRNYVELYNTGDDETDLSDYYLTDKRSQPKRFSLKGVSIPAHGYMLIWLGGRTDEEKKTDDASYVYPIDDTGLHLASLHEATFDLNKDGDDLFLISGNPSATQHVHVPELQYNTCYSRVTDGSDRWRTATCTPGVSNNEAAEQAETVLAEPEFSRESGFYDQDFTLRLTSDTGQIYYTLDGSNPAPGAASTYLYENGIEITDVSDTPNRYAAISDIMIPSNYTPARPVDKAVIVRAAVYDVQDNQRSDTVTKTYFIGYEERKEYQDLPVISVVSDPSNLFDYYRGIYTTGVTYESYLKEGGFEDWPADKVPGSFFKDEDGNIYYSGEDTSQLKGELYLAYQWENARQHGRMWERDASISYYDENHTLEFEQNVGIRIAGQSSRALLQKSLNLYARKAYDTAGNGKFTYPFFHDEGTVDKFRLRRADTTGFSKDAFLMMLAEDRDAVAVQRGRPVVVFLDGEYWGLYYLREQYRKDYFEYYYQVDGDQLWMLKNSEAVMGGEEAVTNFNQLVDQITLMDMTDPVQYGVVERNINL